ncbi:hypothetical protein NKH79_33910, partial [Mesorhizobium sp. M0977]
SSSAPCFSVSMSRSSPQAAPDGVSLALTAETRRTLTKLMVRLILDHADGDLARERQEGRHDV